MSIDEQVERAGRERRVLVVVVLLVVGATVVGLATSVLLAVASGDGDAVAGAAGALWLLGLLLPVAVVALAAALRRDPGSWLWAALAAGAVVVAAGPVLALVAHGGWDATVLLAGRWGSSSELSLTAFAWLSWVTAAALLAGALVGHRRLPAPPPSAGS
ncbi:hypothetical protein FHE66_09915 [Georgenia sp. 311]|uniref:Uncharacterized protein n=1 Tax=Georgenia wutianyii TaxID=2585135 RepID=A0ABX5VII8_9MICO|nr:MULTISPECIES: hypothetical protein [Georgenia]QDB78147.1 hypothetical protein FE251_01240 [Georgenia wutianyii]TNC17592.1 hypothetical protein FHE66_09915 [Georgenia sp. 311]